MRLGCAHTLTQLRSAEAAEAPALKTIPGESSSFTFLSKCTSCTDLVTPGVLPTTATRVRLSELMSDDLPTLGRPITPAADDHRVRSDHEVRVLFSSLWWDKKFAAPCRGNVLHRA